MCGCMLIAKRSHWAHTSTAESWFYYTEIYVPFPIKMKDIQQKLAKYAKVLRILNNTFKATLIQKFSRLDVLAVPILLYGNDIWNHRKEEKND